MIACIFYFPIQDQPLMAGITEQVVAIVRKISSGSSRDLPPSYSKVISDRCLIHLRSKFRHTIYSKTPFQFRLEEGFFNEELLKYFLMFQVDLTQVGLTINDHLNPPPHYDVVTDEEVSGDTRYLNKAVPKHIKEISVLSSES